MNIINNYLRRSLLIIALAVLCPLIASAQVPARFYWKTLSGANGVPMIYQSISGNSNPMDPALMLSPEANIDAEIMTAGYAKFLPIFGRSAMVAVLEPMGRLSSSTDAAGMSAGESARGYGDPMLEFDINLIGPPAIMNIPDMLRYEPKFSLDLLVDAMVPVGEYDSEQSLNLGQNRWYGRVGAPMILQIGSWVPGKRTTFELLPSVWWFSDNDDFMGENLSTDAKYQVEGHLTQDFSDTLWGSLDSTWISGGASTVGDHEKGDPIDSLGVGGTLGYQVSDNLSFTLSYMSTVNDSDPGDLQMDRFMITVVYGWHKVVEGMKRLQSGH